MDPETEADGRTGATGRILVPAQDEEARWGPAQDGGPVTARRDRRRIERPEDVFVRGLRAEDDQVVKDALVLVDPPGLPGGRGLLQHLGQGVSRGLFQPRFSAAAGR